MAATGKTPILLYGSTTPTNTPTAGNLTNSSDGCEIAINVADKNLFFKDSTNAVNTVPIRQSSASSNGWLSSTDWTTFNNKANAFTYTNKYVPYGQGTTTPTQSANLQFDGTNLSIGGGLGVGTTANTSLAKLYVSGTSGTLPMIIATNNGNNSTLSSALAFTTDNTAYSAKIQVIRGVGSYDLGLAFRTVNSGATELESMRLNSSGGVSIGNTTDPGATNLSVSGFVKTLVTTVAGLPSAATVGAGARAFVTNALTPVFGSAVVGGGAINVPVYSTGSAWFVG